MADKDEKKWDDISSDEETYQRPVKTIEKPIEQPKQERQEKHQERKQREQEEGGEEGGDRPQYEKKRYPNKSEMIDEIKKMDTQQVQLNIFKLEQTSVAVDIYTAFKDVKIQKIFKEQRAGTFTVDFETKEDAIHFVKVAPRPIKGRNFVMRISNKRQRMDKDGWNEIGTGGKVYNNKPYNNNRGGDNGGWYTKGEKQDNKGWHTKGEQTGNKYNDKPAKNKFQYDRTKADNFYADSESQVKSVKEQGGDESLSKEQQENIQEGEQQQKQFYQNKNQGGYKKPYNKNYNNNKGGQYKNYKKSSDQQEENVEEGDQKQFQKFGFRRGPSKEGEEQKKDKEGFTQVKAKSEKRQENVQSEEKQENKQQQDDGWNVIGGKKKNNKGGK